ncbi:hypothetical protein CVT24_010991 [Panaeolus cyanescens]|uniref:Protein kinase domain-containing protein n=1 Tax=Panaeolus cyanescens TaxID=181874 RepID=A0A409WE11_9AGAR|nr:hypothetical protein CVT24_010991 [Panaeolus cyanescens]
MDPTFKFSNETINELFASTANGEKIEQYLRQSRYYHKDWKGVSIHVEGQQDLYGALLAIFQDILGYFHPKQGRLVHCLKNNEVEVQDEDETTLSPDFLVTGNGSHFRYLTHKKSWSCCASFIDAKRDKWAHSQEIDWEKRFAGYARQCFIAHPTRIFVYGLCVTETMLRLYRYDRCGVLHSEWINYRQENAHRLVRALLLLSSSNAADLGFDETVVINEDGKHVFSMQEEDQPVRLTEVRLLWDSMSLFGRATTCWKVVDESKQKTFLLKQQFVNVKQTPEDQLLDDIQDIKGIVKVHFAQRIGKPMSELRRSTSEDFPDRFLYRMVLEEYGKSIKYVTDIVLLVKALRDAITAHYEAYVKKDVLHRDISADNILYAKDPKNLREGEGYGNLIDFDLSINLNRATCLDEQDFQMGTHAFHSIAVLMSSSQSSAPYRQGYVDDLESFFWVLVWILIRYLPPVNGELARKTQNPDQLDRLASFDGPPLPSAERKQCWLTWCSNRTAKDFLDQQWGSDVIKFVEE